MKHCQALAAAHTLFDPVQSAPYLAAQIEFMYRVLILEETLERRKGGGSINYDATLSNDFVHHHLVHAIEGALQTKRRLSQARTWRLPPCIDRSSIRILMDCLVDGCWGVTVESASLAYLIQRYKFKGEN